MTELTRKLVDAVGNAFNANDIDAVMQYLIMLLVQMNTVLDLKEQM